ncbi:hypothetical protein P280DRAFT_503431 [Massarina eburnea CBS 473.64]|uniref:Uncharacterized protein n=1 Tax=Massarina eburnea CBS 473.64 TaxID=1395130 RepID=A0A6A6SG46_9PLEO|nr:hypothetical protein P280DRAFT_503431 [Massarina eburnea CBS 473.64]
MSSRYCHSFQVYSSATQPSSSQREDHQAAPMPGGSYVQNLQAQISALERLRALYPHQAIPIPLSEYSPEQVQMFCDWYNDAPDHIQRQVWKRVPTGQVTTWCMPLHLPSGTVAPPTPLVSSILSSPGSVEHLMAKDVLDWSLSLPASGVHAQVGGVPTEGVFQQQPTPEASPGPRGHTVNDPRSSSF